MLATRLSKSIGKKGILKISFFIQFIHALAAWFLITPDHPYLQVIAYAIGAAGNMTFFLMLHSMTSDICDADELENGTRREGMYGAVITSMQKLCVHRCGARRGHSRNGGLRSNRRAIQTDQTALSLRLIYSGIFVTTSIVSLAYATIRSPRKRCSKFSLFRGA